MVYMLCLRPFALRLTIVLFCATFLLIGTGGNWMAWLGSVGFVAGMLGEAYMRAGRIARQNLNDIEGPDEDAR